MSGILIVGAGQAGFQAAASLREAGFTGSLTLVGEEAQPPYQRPPLSKAYLAGKTDARGLLLRPESFFAEHGIVHRRARATGIDRAQRRVRLEEGEALAYDHLILATGTRNRALPVPGADRAGVYGLRSLDEADALKGALERAKTIVVIGAGFIGLEFAAVCAARGLSVTVIEAAPRVMARAVSPETSDAFRAFHEAAGVTILFETGVSGIEGAEGRVRSVALADGKSLPADLVLVGIGVVPNQELAAEAGLTVQDGIAVDAFLATSDPAISAIGDCARFPTRFAAGLPGGDRVRIESVQNAVDQGRCLAARLTGRPAAYDAVPWFWSDQGPRKLQIAGLGSPDDASVLRRAGAGFSVFRFRDGRLAAVESVDRPADHMAARRIIAADRSLTPEQAADERFDLKALATA
ncbi:NAD(P)/FAD-dependent oxidoreductase [Methylorubrum salsuginis]|uniref:3-phenylpropionate/trans-cinnamate dioxygenase ferredoxin reductase subunit n=1 Tax=Methylorubrum salsuginis TaxID=414703 RepID=A0A1I4DMB0_9HYPH|nr:FAD-dependent oxidoreductase [Methylorubrum salsuginis]SFK94415.1 3-phenylpropionate/trans-cinnamate dioxygenase ferredoxin reductase subunit [Methylorubrum salsuginis]